MILLARHGQTAFNAEGRLQGHFDSPLTDRGLAQAQAMGRAVAGEVTAPLTILASPLGRAHATARIIAGMVPAQITLDDGLREVSLGLWDGHTSEEIEAGWPGARDGLWHGEWFFMAPEGERFAGFSARLAAALARARETPRPVLIVAHGVVGQVLRGLWSGLGQLDAMQLEAPQDALFALEPGGAIRRIPTSVNSL
jgi:broad specificity phosphatase PhoE